MSAPAWLRVGDPFHAEDLDWTVVEVSEAGDEVRLEPRLRVAALHARLDAVLGVGGWSVAYAALAEGAVACHLTIDGITKGVVVPAALAGGGAATAAVALGAAAALFGARPPWPEGASAWVACDPSTLEPLHPPEPPDGEPHAAREGPPTATAVDAALLGSPRPRPGPPAAGSAAAAPPAPSDPAPPLPPGVRPLATTEAAPPAPKPEGQQMIDRLIERLKAEGQGLAAARILVKHGGYGKDPRAARDLYGELRELLRAGAGERDPETEPSSGGPA